MDDHRFTGVNHVAGSEGIRDREERAERRALHAERFEQEFRHRVAVYDEPK